jgi:hypothetical protein
MPSFTKLLPIALSALVPACASNEVRTLDHYERGDTSQAQFQKEASLCDKQAEADQKQMGYRPYDPCKSQPHVRRLHARRRRAEASSPGSTPRRLCYVATGDAEFRPLRLTPT